MVEAEALAALRRPDEACESANRAIACAPSPTKAQELIRRFETLGLRFPGPLGSGDTEAV